MNYLNGPVLMTHHDDFAMTISGAKDYDFKLEPIDNPTSSTWGTLSVDPDWGGKTIYYFSGVGPHLFEDYHFECPAATNGTCDAYVSVDQYSGAASGYVLDVDPTGHTPFQVSPITGNPSNEVAFGIDESWTYDFDIETVGGSTSESFSVEIIRPDGIAHVRSFYGYDMTGDPPTYLFDTFDYFECPY